MSFSLNNKHIFFASISLIISLLIMPAARATNTIKKPKHNNNRYSLVPPPPPYVPSMLPELARYPGYGQTYYSNSARQSGNSPILYKPNKYLTYCYPNKG